MGATLAPDRYTQAMEAKQQADLIRALRKQLRIDLAACRNKRESLAMAARFIGDPPYWLQNMTIGDLLLSCRGVGRSVVIRACDNGHVSALRTIGELAQMPGRRAMVIAAIQRMVEAVR